MTTPTSLTAYVVTASVARLGADARWRHLLDRDAWALADAFARHCPAARMPAFLAPLGFTLERCVTYGALQREHRGPAETRRVPEEDENYYLATRARAGARSTRGLP